MESTTTPVISAKNLNLWYGDFKALKNISLDVGEREITALMTARRSFPAGGRSWTRRPSRTMTPSAPRHSS